MFLNIVCTSKPVDGLLYYSYEYCSYLQTLGINARLVIVCHRRFPKETYISAITNKYIHYQNVVFDDFTPAEDDITLVMGRSMLTLSWQDFDRYRPEQQSTLRRVFAGNLISVYSENHPEGYPRSVEFYSPTKIVDLCDMEVYPRGVGEHFEKTINFEIYKPHVDNIQFDYLFQGTNDKYYATAEKYIEQFPNYGILTYNEKFINPSYNNIFAPVENLLGIFNTYVYVKETFDPAPRIVQECKYFEKGLIYLRDESIHDGGSVYWKRPIKKVEVGPILNAIEKLQGIK
jgi:hypothetical protein